jgi:hypothetical protein
MVQWRMLSIIIWREQAKLQWLHDPSEINEDNLNNVRHETSRYFRNKKREYQKDKISELEELIFSVIEYVYMSVMLGR